MLAVRPSKKNSSMIIVTFEKWVEVFTKKGNKKISSKSKIKKIKAIKKKCSEILGRNSGVEKNPHSKGLSLS